MALLSGAEDHVTVIHARGTRARKQQKDEISKSETSDIPARKPAKKKPGPKPKPTTTAKARKKTPGPTSKTRDLDIDSDSDVEEVKKPKAKNGAEVVTAIGTHFNINSTDITISLARLTDIIFMIPEAGCDRDHVRDYSAARKPTLAYKLSSAGQKSAPINLRTSKDWDGLIKSKKDLSTMSMLTVLPDNYMFSLRNITRRSYPMHGFCQTKLRVRRPVSDVTYIGLLDIFGSEMKTDGMQVFPPKNSGCLEKIWNSYSLLKLKRAHSLE
ncbi:hypothetical protein K438DRAFT_2066998 [Mycena galopus ATCC 62051]|nr:hypothetical protein K438DRAFT_2066998 [Mycena galopus ATCC 62051]